MLICPKCERIAVKDTAAFCAKDGVRLVEKPRCGACGAAIYPSDAYCCMCGHVLADGFKPLRAEPIEIGPAAAVAITERAGVRR